MCINPFRVSSLILIFLTIIAISCKPKGQSYIDQNTIIYSPEKINPETMDAGRRLAEHYPSYSTKCREQGFVQVDDYGQGNISQCIKCPDKINGKKVVFDRNIWCVWCEKGTYYRDTSISCDTSLSCANQNKCRWCTKGYTLKPYNGTKTCLKCNAKTKHRPSIYFKPNTPKYITYNGRNYCVDCANGYNFNRKQNKCIKCGKRETFNDLFSKCIKKRP